MAWWGAFWVTGSLVTGGHDGLVCRAPPRERPPPGPPPEGGPDQAVPRHPTSFAECCFLPDLTRFAIRRCAGPDPQRRLGQRPPSAEASRGNSALLERIAGTGHPPFPAADGPSECTR